MKNPENKHYRVKTGVKSTGLWPTHIHAVFSQATMHAIFDASSLYCIFHASLRRNSIQLDSQQGTHNIGCAYCGVNV